MKESPERLSHRDKEQQFKIYTFRKHKVGKCELRNKPPCTDSFKQTKKVMAIYSGHIDITLHC